MFKMLIASDGNLFSKWMQQNFSFLRCTFCHRLSPYPNKDQTKFGGEVFTNITEVYGFDLVDAQIYTHPFFGKKY